MKTIHVNLAHWPADWSDRHPATLTVDTGHIAQMLVSEDRTRGRFLLPDHVPPWGATLRWGPNGEHETRTVIPTDPGDYEGAQLVPPLPGVLTYGPAQGQRLVVAGTRFALADGSPWFGLTATDFLLFNRYLRDEDIEPIIRERLAAGFNECRVTLTMEFLPRILGWPVLAPASYGFYWDQLPSFVGLCGEHGLRLKLTLLCDCQATGYDRADSQHALVADVCTLLKGFWNVRFELGNEYQANGFNPANFDKPAGILISRGSSSIDVAPYAPGWDYHEWHGRRDWPKYLNVDDVGFISRGNIDGVDSRDTPKPCDHSEPIGFAETAVPGRRLTSPVAAAGLRRANEAFAAAVCFHSEDGLFSRPWGPVQLACARAFTGVSR